VPRYLPKTRKGLDNYLRKRDMAYYDPWYQWTQTTTSASTMNTWNLWVDNGTAATSPSIVWNTWNQTQGTALTTNTTAWTAWNVPAGYHPAVQGIVGYQPRQLTPEEIRERDERLEQLRIEQEERRQREAEAREHAKALLLDHLSPAQKREYEQAGQFKVEVGARTFVIGRGTHGNVKEIHLQNGQEITLRSFCIPPVNGSIPEPDVHLAQKLMLEGGDESIRDFHRIANITDYRPDLVPRLDRELAAA
jgi:hypothetical protein